MWSLPSGSDLRALATSCLAHLEAQASAQRVSSLLFRARSPRLTADIFQRARSPKFPLVRRCATRQKKRDVSRGAGNAKISFFNNFNINGTLHTRMHMHVSNGTYTISPHLRLSGKSPHLSHPLATRPMSRRNSSPRAAQQEWEAVEVLRSGPNPRWKCKSCQTNYTGAPRRIAQHILGVREDASWTGTKTSGATSCCRCKQRLHPVRYIV